MAKLVAVRKRIGITQAELAKAIGLAQYDVSKVESCVRRLDILELRDWLQALKVKSDIIKSLQRELETQD